jgi:hypothetical protein
MDDIAVVITCHQPHLRWLPEALASIERQVPAPAERLIVFDRCAPPTFIGQEWRCLSGDWGDPSPARNAAMEATTAPWLVFLDADNLAPVGYLSAVQSAIAAVRPKVGIIYPHIQRIDETGKPLDLWRVPDWDYWGMRAQNCVDTSSAWRRDALELVGGWPVGDSGSHEDYALALLVTAAGWGAARLDGPAIVKRAHPSEQSDRSHRDGALRTGIWHARSLAIVTLLAGREQTLEAWPRFLLTAELPPRTSLYVLDNSGDPAFTRRVLQLGEHVTEQRGLGHFDFAPAGQPYRRHPTEPDLTRQRHFHVARLYTTVLPRVTEDLVLTLEDDVEPPPNAVRLLGEEIGYAAHGNVGAVASAYSTAVAQGALCAGWGSNTWGPSVNWQELTDEPIDVGFVGGGCTVWANWALRSCPAHVEWDHTLGWDAVLCMELRLRGFRVRLHGGVRSHHRVGDRVQDTPSRSTVGPRPVPPRALVGPHLGPGT